MGGECSVNGNLEKCNVLYVRIDHFTGLGVDGRIILKYCSMHTRCWVTTSKQTRRQHSLLGNRFLINKYTQPLLGNAVAITLARKQLQYDNERCSQSCTCRDVVI
jgi:hypothetical protein